jgi:hypothetical protein
VEKSERVRSWHVPLSHGDATLGETYAEIRQFGIKAEDLPFLVRLIENPEYDLPGFDLFHGATDLKTHDQIHIVLGRGLLAKDEAFVIGFTMGSTDRVSASEERLFGLLARYLYPRQYRFDAEDLRVFRDAVRLGFVSDCRPLHEVRYDDYADLPLREVRKALGIEEDLLRAYYAIERRRCPQSFESQRLLD